jgi:hypothetical protein
MSEVNREVITKWVEALESGEYPQTTGRLQRTGPGYSDQPIGYCCLGVLCEIAAENGITYKEIPSLDDHPTGVALFGGDDLLPPNSVKEWAGLDSANPLLTVEVPTYDYDLEREVLVEGDHQLSELNDEYGWTFAEIAAELRKKYLS